MSSARQLETDFQQARSVLHGAASARVRLWTTMRFLERYQTLGHGLSSYAREFLPELPALVAETDFTGIDPARLRHFGEILSRVSRWVPAEERAYLEGACQTLRAVLDARLLRLGGSPEERNGATEPHSPLGAPCLWLPMTEALTAHTSLTSVEPLRVPALRAVRGAPDTLLLVQRARITRDLAPLPHGFDLAPLAQLVRRLLESGWPNVATHGFHGTLTFDPGEGEAAEANLGLALVLCLALSQQSGHRTALGLRTDVAVLGALSPSGQVHPLPPEILQAHAPATFFSPANVLVVPASQEEATQATLQPLRQRFPHRSFDVVGVHHLADLIAPSSAVLQHTEHPWAQHLLAKASARWLPLATLLTLGFTIAFLAWRASTPAEAPGPTTRQQLAWRPPPNQPYDLVSLTSAPTPSDDAGHLVAVQTTGDVIVAGTTEPDEQVFLIRFRANGTPDPTFGHQGRTLLPLYTRAVELAITATDQIIVLGPRASDPASPLALTRLTPDGSIDTTFGQRGWVSPQLLRPLREPERSAVPLLLQPDGGIVLVGVPLPGLTPTLRRISSNGIPDSTFDRAVAHALSDSPTQAQIAALVGLPDGHLLVALNATDTPAGPTTLVRLTPDGHRDMRFGTAGGVHLSQKILPGRLTAMTLRSDGLLVLAAALVPSSTTRRLSFVTLEADGRPLQASTDQDATAVQAEIPSTNIEAWYAWPDGSLLVTGSHVVNARPQLWLLHIDPQRRAAIPIPDPLAASGLTTVAARPAIRDTGAIYFTGTQSTDTPGIHDVVLLRLAIRARH